MGEDEKIVTSGVTTKSWCVDNMLGDPFDGSRIDSDIMF